MKLYEFTYNDNTNLSESEVLERLTLFLAEEAVVRNWAPGYILRQRQPAKQLADNQIKYFFVVEGEEMSGSPDIDQNSELNQLSNIDIAASP